jgi:hypothetical protein
MMQILGLRSATKEKKTVEKEQQQQEEEEEEEVEEGEEEEMEVDVHSDVVQSNATTKTSTTTTMTTAAAAISPAPKSYVLGPARPLRLVYCDEKGKFKMDPEAVAALQVVKGPVGVVSVCGRARQGKSFILNQVCELAKTKFHLQRRLKVLFFLAKDVIYFITTVEFAMHLLISNPKKNKEFFSNLIHSLSHAENDLKRVI